MTLVSLPLPSPTTATPAQIALLEGMLEAAWLVDGSSRRILAVNAGAAALLGLSAEQWQGQGV
ncbi:MAG: PAS domain-containing protein, partial [Paucibacter sp.]|nr:PAS domain-containing protein [Roseateles sp.]